MQDDDGPFALTDPGERSVRGGEEGGEIRVVPRGPDQSTPGLGLELGPADAAGAPSGLAEGRNGTLAALWGMASSSEGGSVAGNGAGSASATAGGAAAKQRKRRKKDTGPPQGRLVFSVDGMKVATPAPVVEEGGEDMAEEAPKKRGRPRKRKNDDEPPSVPEEEATPRQTRRRPRASSADIVVTAVVPAQQSGAAHDPVCVPDSPAGPKKVVFASDSKPVHAFFGMGRGGPAVAATETEREEEEAHGEGIEGNTASSGEASTSAPQTNGTKVHGFFSMAPPPGQLKKGWGSVKEGEEPIALWPGGNWPNHLGASRLTATEARIPRRAAPPVPLDAERYHYRSSPESPRLPAYSPEVILSHTALALSHPAIAAVSRARPDGRESWCDQHRPRSAACVLGNEAEATYLRDWLRALSIGSKHRVWRRVPRKRLADPDKQWIVDDLGWFGDAVDEEAPEIQAEDEDLPLGARPSTYPEIADDVFNTICLTGPSGSGKSAAVYAAAAELGWEVFEVYPGIGRRTGAHLLSLVGDVGRNHMVRDRGEKKDKEKKSAAEAVKAMFGKAASSQGSADEPIELDNDSPIHAAGDKTSEDKTGDKTRQSLILIEEADILFDERDTFWPTLIGLIAESRRPVVITCNDTRLLPMNSLPIQYTLQFRPPSRELAEAYLGAIGGAHGLKCLDVRELYDQCSRAVMPDLIDAPLPPNGNEPAALFDLRAAITQLQLDRGRPTRRRPAISVDDPKGDLGSLARRIEAASFADAYIAPRAWSRMEVSEIDRLHPGQDDMDAVCQLVKPDTQHLRPILASVDRSDSIASTLTSLAGGALPAPFDIQLGQTAHTRALLPLLDTLVPLSARLLPHPSLYTELAPTVRAMIAADDVLEIADREAAGKGEIRLNRKGRTIRRANEGYERWLSLSEEALRVGRESGL